MLIFRTFSEYRHSFFAQKKVGRLVADEDIIIKILWRHKEYQMCFGNQTIGYAMEQAQ